MELQLDTWRRDWKLMSVFFDGSEISAITKRLRNLRIHNLVFCSFESRFARSGGLASVTMNILPYLKEVNNIPSVILMTPFYPNIIDSRKLKSSGLRPVGRKFSVPYLNRNVPAELFEYTFNYTKPVKGSIREYYLKAEGFFATSRNMKDPYLYYEDNADENNTLLSNNALFFCRAVPYAVRALDITEDIVFHLHEWQTALVSLTAKESMMNGTLTSCGTVQTMHNSYDASLSWEHLSRILDRERRAKIAGFSGYGISAYQVGLQLVDAPVTTVSEHFASELTEDPVQTEHYAPHLQNILRTNRVFGVNNGMFTDFSPEFPKQELHTIDEIRAIKKKNRSALLRILSRYRPKERFGELTYKRRTITKLPDQVPIIVMSGRLDPAQKGFFVLLRAVERFAEDDIKVILTPMPVRTSDLDYFYEVTCKCRGNVTVFSERMVKGFHELQTGSTFGIMPSIYEPFGAAVEYMTSGTVNIGRATGGLVDQIERECGFLFKEEAVFHTPENITDYIQSTEIMQMKKLNVWAQSMADNLYEVLRKATDTYQRRPDVYYQMIINGFKQAKQFSWTSSATKYYQVYEKIRSA